MNTNSIQGNWQDIKAKIKSRWSKFSDNEIDAFKDNLDKITTQVQKTYGTAKEIAEREFKDFKTSLQATGNGDKTRIIPLPPTPQPVKPQASEKAKADMVSEGGKEPVSKAV